MSRLSFPALLLLSALALAAGCGASLAAAIQDPDMVVLPDPVLPKAVRFPAGAATQGAARIGPALDKAGVSASGCSALNPCAVADPSGSDATAPRQQLGERKRTRRSG